MKNILTKLIAIMLVVCSLFTLTACGDTGSGGGTGGSGGGHVHDYVDHVCSCGDVEKYTEGLKFKENTKGGVTVLGFEDGVTVPDTVYVPQKHNGKKVTAIGQSAFAGATFKNIVLPEGLEEIFSYAFQDSQLGAVTIPTTVHHIHPQAFDTDSLKSATFLTTEGWYISRHYKSNPSASEAKSSDTMSNAGEIADAISNTNRGTSAAYSHWFRVVK